MSKSGKTLAETVYKFNCLSILLYTCICLPFHVCQWQRLIFGGSQTIHWCWRLMRLGNQSKTGIVSGKQEWSYAGKTQITQGVAGKLVRGWRDNQCLQFCGEEKCWSNYKMFFFHRVQAQLHYSQTRTLFLLVEEKAASSISLSLVSLAVIRTVNNRGVLPGFSVPWESLNLVSVTKDGVKKHEVKDFIQPSSPRKKKSSLNRTATLILFAGASSKSLNRLF